MYLGRGRPKHQSSPQSTESRSSSRSYASSSVSEWQSVYDSQDCSECDVSLVASSSLNVSDTSSSYSRSGDSTDHQKVGSFHSNVGKKDTSGTKIYPDLSCFNDTADEDGHAASLGDIRPRRPLWAVQNEGDSSPAGSQTQQRETASPFGNHAIYIAVLVGSLVVARILYPYFWPPIPKPTPGFTSSETNTAVQLYLKYFQDIRGSFGGQDVGFWRILRAGTKPVVEQDDPVQPAVFIFVIPSDAVATADCLIQQFSEMITKLFRARQPVEFLAKDAGMLSPADIKHQLDDTLNEGLSAGSRVAVIHHLEQLPAESAMMLHSYCDNENAPYRRAVFILTLYVEQSSSMVTESDAFVEDRLQMLWGRELGTNRLPPLLSRIANSIAFVRPESADVLKQNKCAVRRK